MRKLLALSCALLMLGLSACNEPQITSGTPASLSGEGKVALNLKLGKVGMLARSAEMVPTTLIVTFQPYYDYTLPTIHDTIQIDGASNIRSSYELPAGYYEIYTTGYDQRGMVLYSGTNWLYVYDQQTTTLSLHLEAQYSSIKAGFPVVDSLERFTFAVDGSVWGDSSVDWKARSGDTVVMSFDYLTAYYVWHQFELKAYGATESGESLLYQLDTGLYVYPGQLQDVVFTLHWVGDGVPPGNRTNLTVSLGAVGQLNITATYGIKEPTIPWNTSYWFGSVYDYRDGREYRTIQVGPKLWMAENLNFAGSAGDSLGRCYNDDPAKCTVYGRLYTWKETMPSSFGDSSGMPPQGICPSGFHVPSQSDWQTLLTYIDDSAKAGDLLKSLRGWSDRGNGSDFFGFRATPAGYLYGSDSLVDSTGANRFHGLGAFTYFRSSTATDDASSWSVYLMANSKEASTTAYLPNSHAFSVRCVSDNY